MGYNLEDNELTPRYLHLAGECFANAEGNIGTVDNFLQSKIYHLADHAYTVITENKKTIKQVGPCCDYGPGICSLCISNDYNNTA